jgi:hypothetical protein
MGVLLTFFSWIGLELWTFQFLPPKQLELHRCEPLCLAIWKFLKVIPLVYFAFIVFMHIKLKLRFKRKF